MPDTPEQHNSRAMAQIKQVATRLVQLGWDAASGGNLSLSSPHPPERWCIRYRLGSDDIGMTGPSSGLLMTASGCRWREVAKDPSITTVFIDYPYDNPFVRAHVSQLAVWSSPECSDIMPTSELPTHGRIHSLRSNLEPSEYVVLHAHPPALVALALLPATQCAAALKLLPRLFPEAALLLQGDIPLVPYHRPGSIELAQATINAFTQSSIAVWHKHGAIAAADSADKVLDILETAESAAQIYWRFLHAGLTPELLSDQELVELVHDSTISQ